MMLLGGMTLASLAQAEGIGLGVHAGLMGPGIDGFYRLNEKLVLRGAYNSFDYDYDATEEDVEYEATYSFDNAQVGVDWYPFTGSFRLSAAYLQNGNELNLHAVPTGGAFDLNGVSYGGSEVADMRVTVDYPDSGAYVGLGWGNPVAVGKGFGVTFDLGVYYLGEPEVAQQLTCGTTLRCAQLQADAEADRQKLEDDLSDFPFWPLVQLGLSYQF
ncbi:MAG: hisitdine kinase [Moraxellaceae bacterium]|nr:hisitdine kinase [Moraxellaceae bacterium]